MSGRTLTKAERAWLSDQGGGVVDARFGIVPEWVAKEVHGLALNVYVHLALAADGATGVAFPSQGKLAAACGLSRTSTDRIRAALYELRKIGAIDWMPRRNGDGGQSSNLYLVRRNQPAAGASSSTPRGDGKTREGVQGHSGTPPHVTVVPPPTDTHDEQEPVEQEPVNNSAARYAAGRRRRSADPTDTPTDTPPAHTDDVEDAEVIEEDGRTSRHTAGTAATIDTPPVPPGQTDALEALGVDVRAPHTPDDVSPHAGDADAVGGRTALATITDDTDPTPPRQDTAQGIIARWIDWQRSKGVIIPSRMIGHTAREVKQLLADGIDPDTVVRALAENTVRGLHPSTLASTVLAVQGPRISASQAARRTRRADTAASLTDRAVAAAARLAQTQETYGTR